MGVRFLCQDLVSFRSTAIQDNLPIDEAVRPNMNLSSVRRLFRARRESNILHFPLMALILSLMHIAVEPNGGGGVPGVFDPFWQRLATVNFLQIYAGPWRSVGSRRPKQAIVPHWSMWMHLYFVIRHFATSYDTVEGGDAATQGLCCDREAGMVQSLAGDTLSFRERRTLVALKTTTNLGSVSHAQLPFSTVLVVSDSELSLSITEDTWFQANLFPCREGSGIALFQLVVWCALDKWMAEWDECLGNIDEILKVKVRLERPAHQWEAELTFYGADQRRRQRQSKRRSHV